MAEKRQELSRIAKLSRHGWRVDEIARKVGKSERQIKRDLKFIADRYLDRAIRERKAMMEETTDQYNEWLVEAWKNYLRSRKQDKVTIKTEPEALRDAQGHITGYTGHMVVSEVTTVKNDLPDVAWMDRALVILAQKRKLWALDEPKQVKREEDVTMRLEPTALDVLAEIERIAKSATGFVTVEDELEQAIKEVEEKGRQKREAAKAANAQAMPGLNEQPSAVQANGQANGQQFPPVQPGF
jgi:hypothetical protein